MKSASEPQRISGLTIASVVVLLMSCALVFGLVLLITAQPTTEQQTAAIHARNPAFNLEQTTPNADTQALEATQEAMLQGYGWIDQNAGIARIPIERAMALIVTEQPELTATAQP